MGTPQASSLLRSPALTTHAHRGRGLAFSALFLVLGLALLAAGLIDLFRGELAVGSLQMAAAGGVGVAAGRSFVRQFRPAELTAVEALAAAAVFALFGLLGLSATLSGDAVRTAFGALAAALLLPTAALIVLVVVRARRRTRRAAA